MNFFFFFLAGLGLHHFVWFFCCGGGDGEWGLLLVTVSGGLSCFRAQALELGLRSCGAWFQLFLQHVESCWTRDRTHVLTGRQIPIH